MRPTKRRKPRGRRGGHYFKRLIPECFNRDGKAKRKHVSAEAALAFKASRPKDKHLQKAHPYECPTCGSWHLGTGGQRR